MTDVKSSKTLSTSSSSFPQDSLINPNLKLHNYGSNNVRPVTQRFKLTDSTKAEIKSLTPNFGFNGLGEVVFRRTYSRDNESWHDVVIRVIEGVMSIRKEHYYRNSLEWEDSAWQTYAREMALSMFKMEWLPPGRGLWMMGTDFVYNRGSASLYNCFEGSERFWTKEGLKAFNEFKDGDKVEVRGRNTWFPATVRNYGTQKLWEIKIKRFNSPKTIYTTENHRWIASESDARGRRKKNFQIYKTSELKEYMKLAKPAVKTCFHNLEICPVGIQHGIVFGDGTYSKYDNVCRVVLFGEKKQLSKYFFTERRENKNITGLPNTWKTLPSLSMNKGYLLGFMAGIFATDGCIQDDCNMTITSSNEDTIKFYRNALFMLDIMCSEPILTIKKGGTPYHTNGQDSKLYQLIIYRENKIPLEFFLREDQREKYHESDKDPYWRVVSVQETDYEEDVWCVEEPEHEEFTLECGVLTKNCAATDTKEDVIHSAEWTMDSLMNGIGVGFNTDWRGSATIPDKTDTYTYTIPDSREGWCESLVRLMCSYIDSPRYGKGKFPTFDYSKVRPAGVPIKGFGGVASGPEPLMKLHRRVEEYLDNFCNGYITVQDPDTKEDVKKPYSHTRLVADVFNAIGACVVAGNVRRCLPGDAMVHTKQGLVPIKDVEIGMEVLTSDNYRKVKNKFIQGEQKLLKIITEQGEFRCSTDHKMAIADSEDNGEYVMTKACEIKVGNLMCVTNVPIEGSLQLLPTCDDLEVPKLDEDMCWLLGYIQQKYFEHKKNGHGVLKIAYETKESCTRAMQQLVRFSNPEVTHDSSHIICSNPIIAWYIQEFLPKNTIPEFIRKNTVENRLAYLFGLYDNTRRLSRDSKDIVFKTIYNNFLKDIQNLLYSCGVESKYESGGITCGPCSCGHKDGTITLVNDHGRKIFSERRYSESDFVYNTIKVLEVVPDSTEETYDIEVENRHEFFCNGYLSSNSAEIALGSISDRDFINLKNYTDNPERAEIGWMSNNSVVLKENGDFQDFTHIPEMAQRIRDNGEPGLINLYNIQKYGRFGKEMKDEATLVNPCSEISFNC